MVRRITHSDMPNILSLSRKCYDEMNFDDFGYRYDDEQIERSWNMGIEGNLLRGYISGESDGLFLLSITEITAYFKGGKKLAQEIVFHANPDLSPMKRIKVMAEMVDFVIGDLKTLGVTGLYVSSDARFNTVSRLLEKRGFKPLSIAHYLEV